MPDTSTERAQVIALAREALLRGMANDWPAATAAVVAIHRDHGGPGLMVAVLAWCDTIAMRHPALKDQNPGDLVRLAWTEQRRGGVLDADDVTPQVRWAGQVIMARALMDKDAFDALMAALPDDGWEIGDYVGALLRSVALTLGTISGA